MNEEIKILDVKIQKYTIDSLNDLVLEIILNNEKEIIANHNLHSIFLCIKNNNFRIFFDSVRYIHADGMPLILWAKFLGVEISRSNRITYVDWIYPLLKLCNKYNFKVFYLGGKQGVANKAITILKEFYPNVLFQSASGFFDPQHKDENSNILLQINHFLPNILMVGMGMPRQELWIQNNYHKINANVILTSGACFDYIAGIQKTPPRWMGKVGLEWLYRLLNDPKRLFYRYLIEPIYLFPLLISDIIKYRFKR